MNLTNDNSKGEYLPGCDCVDCRAAEKALRDASSRTTRLFPYSPGPRQGIPVRGDAAGMTSASNQNASQNTQQSESARRKATPIWSGVVRYFPDAQAAKARLSKAGNDKHNPGQPLHWSRDKSTDHGDCILRHQINPEELDPETGELHAAAVAWRADAQLQLLEEKRILAAGGIPLSGVKAPAKPAPEWSDWFSPSIKQAGVRPSWVDRHDNVQYRDRAGRVWGPYRAMTLGWFSDCEYRVFGRRAP